jgi:hypothetical protein
MIKKNQHHSLLKLLLDIYNKVKNQHPTFEYTNIAFVAVV